MDSVWRDKAYRRIVQIAITEHGDYKLRIEQELSDLVDEVVASELAYMRGYDEGQRQSRCFLCDIMES